MVDIQDISPRAGDVLLMVGTTKGAFLFRAPATRGRWERGGPAFPRPRRLRDGLRRARRAAPRVGRAGELALGLADALLRRLRAHLEHGDCEGTVRFPEDTGKSLQRIWQHRRPRRRPAADVLRRRARGAVRVAGRGSDLVAGARPVRPSAPARAGSRAAAACACTPCFRIPATRCRSTSRSPPRGVYRTDDGGATWRTAHQGVRAEFLPDKHPEFGQCVHKVVRHRERPEVMFLQNHWGLYRSDDEGESWTDVAHDVPSDFGFAMAIHPHDPGHGLHRAPGVRPVPLHARGAAARLSARGTARSPGSRSTRGLPQKDAFETVLRDALCTDRLPQGGGLLRHARRASSSPRATAATAGGVIADGLPPVLCVRAAVVGSGRRTRELMRVTFVLPGSPPRPGRRPRGGDGGRAGAPRGRRAGRAVDGAPRAARPGDDARTGGCGPHVNVFVGRDSVRYTGRAGHAAAATARRWRSCPRSAGADLRHLRRIPAPATPPPAAASRWR